MAKEFHPVIRMPKDALVLNLSTGSPPREIGREYAIGRYDEKRPNMYVTELFGGVRDIHMGIDLFAPVGAPVHAFAEGRIHYLAYNDAPLDYGFTIVTRHELGAKALYALHGHLSARSVEGKAPGQRFSLGDVIAWVGDRHENGGWVPHLHFQLSWSDPGKADMPGVVSEEDRSAALEIYPDPRLVLGPIY